jgi:hypothetical protein
MDFEYDTYSSGFVGSQPSYAAEDNIRIVDDTWTRFQFYWLASIQGQLPGVQERNVTLSGNTIMDSSPASLLMVVGSNQAKTAAKYQLTGLTITDNRWMHGPITNDTSGSITTPYASSGANVSYANDVTISNNTFPVFDGTPTYFPDTPFLAVLQADSVSGLRIENNDFTGALGVLHPISAGNSTVVECGNRYRVNGSANDRPCLVSSPSVELPETSNAVIFPVLALAAGGLAFLIHRRRTRAAAQSFRDHSGA